MESDSPNQVDIDNKEQSVEKVKTEHKVVLYRSGSRSEASVSHPDDNQDTILVSDEDKVYAVFDGLSTQRDAAMASNRANDLFSQETKSTPPRTKEGLKAAIKKVSNIIRASNGNEIVATTIACVVVNTETNRVLIGHAGDSRVYILRDGELVTVTHDHSTIFAGKSFDIVNGMQNYLDTVTNKSQLPADMGDIFIKKSSLYKCVGMPNLEADVIEMDFKPGDVYLICSDGISDNLTKEEIKQILMKKGDPEDVANDLVDSAKKVSGSGLFRSVTDDISAIIIRRHDIDLDKQVISVKRSGGSIDQGWSIKSVDDNGMAIVRKRLENGDILTKEDYPIKELLELNPSI